MQEFMSYATKAADCGAFPPPSSLSVWLELVLMCSLSCRVFGLLDLEMAAEVVNLLIPRNESSTPLKRHCTEKDRLQLQRYILVRTFHTELWILERRGVLTSHCLFQTAAQYWTSLTPHSVRPAITLNPNLVY